MGRFAGTLAFALVTALAGCEDVDSASDDDNDDTGTGGPDTDADTDADADADSDTDNGPGVNLHGTVMAPSGAFPIPGALVYLTHGHGSEIPDTVFCYECEDMTGKSWTLSNADGTWTLEGVPAGDWNIVTRKGFFQRERAIVVTAEPDQDVPIEVTTLPADNTGDAMDRIPSYAVALNSWDRPHELLGKLGIAELQGDGTLVFGTEKFDIFNDDVTEPGYPDSSEIYTSLATMENYHMIFMPCTSSHLKYSHLQTQSIKDQIREYVAAGGKLYGTCYGYDWIEQPFPPYIEFPGNDAVILDATHSSWAGPTIITDPDMAAWLQVVQTQDVNNFNVSGAWVHAEQVFEVNDGMGLEEDDGVVKPRVWVQTKNQPIGWACGASGGHCPMTVTYNWGCGKVFFSGYQVVESSSSILIRPQEYVLLYLILEVGVCEGDYIPPEK